MNQAGMLRILNQQQEELRTHYHVVSLLLFGSFARNEANEESDVGLLVEFSQPVGLFQFIELQQKLEALLGRKVDLSTPRSLKPMMKDQVLQEAIRVT